MDPGQLQTHRRLAQEQGNSLLRLRTLITSSQKLYVPGSALRQRCRLGRKQIQRRRLLELLLRVQHKGMREVRINLSCDYLYPLSIRFANFR